MTAMSGIAIDTKGIMGVFFLPYKVGRSPASSPPLKTVDSRPIEKITEKGEMSV